MKLNVKSSLFKEGLQSVDDLCLFIYTYVCISPYVLYFLALSVHAFPLLFAFFMNYTCNWVLNHLPVFVHTSNNCI